MTSDPVRSETITDLESRIVLQRAFRSAMSNVAAAVSVVTTVQNGRPHGTTVSAFMSLSMNPPQVLVSLDRTSALLGRLHVGSLLGLNVLASHQAEVAMRFASKDADRFAELPWRLEHGAPALADRHAWLAGRVYRRVEAGDHVLVLADVLHAEQGEEAPLTYWRRSFGTHQGS